MNQRLLILLLAFAIIIYACSTSKKVTYSSPARSRDSIQMVAEKKARLNSGDNEFVSAKGTDTYEQKDNALVKKYSSLLNTDENNLSNIGLLRFIDDWYGVPYKYGGKTKHGIDCSDFACTLLSNVYGMDTEGSSKDLKSISSPVKKSQLQEGDLVFFKIHKGHVSHVGVYVANGYFIHASTKAGVVISNLNEDYYKKYYCSGGRILNKRITHS